MGTDSFTYTITAGQGASTTATITVTVVPRPQPPPGERHRGPVPGPAPAGNRRRTGRVQPRATGWRHRPPSLACPTRNRRRVGHRTPSGGGGSQPADYSVWVGYADLTDAVPINFPTPWDGSPGVIFKGCPDCPILDTGAVRIVNNTGGTLTVNSVIVRLDTWASTSGHPISRCLLEEISS